MQLAIQPNNPATPSVSILNSKRQIEDFQMMLADVKNSQNKVHTISINRQITSGMIIDWREFGQDDSIKSQLLLKNGQLEENTIFSYLVQEWIGDEPIKVIYRWIRRPKSSSNVISLIEEEHLYRGKMKNTRKNGEGQYIITRRYSDNTEKQQYVKGIWTNDILISGVISDEHGNTTQVQNNVINIRSKKTITAYLEQNKTIRLEVQKMKKTEKLLSPVNKGSKESLSSIAGKSAKKIDHNHRYASKQ